MPVEKFSDLSPEEDLTLRDAGRRFINSYRAAGYSKSYVQSLEETVGYLALYSEEQGWPTVPHITTEHLRTISPTCIAVSPGSKKAVSQALPHGPTGASRIRCT